MDNNSIAVLQDYQTSIESSFKKIERLFTDVEGADLSQQNLASNNINNELNNIKNNMGLIKFEIANLKEESNTNKWNEIVSHLNSRYDSYKERLKQLKNNQTNYANDDPLNIEAKIDLSKLTSQQAMDRGDKILQADRDAIARMKKTVYTDYDTMKDINKELLSQHEKLENAENDLKEIDYSVNRAGKQIKTMAKMYATDKFILCMIACILLVVIVIVIVALVMGSDEEDANAKQDTFKN